MIREPLTEPQASYSLALGIFLLALWVIFAPGLLNLFDQIANGVAHG